MCHRSRAAESDATKLQSSGGGRAPKTASRSQGSWGFICSRTCYAMSSTVQASNSSLCESLSGMLRHV